MRAMAIVLGVIGIIGSFSVFSVAYVATGGGPANATYFYVFHIFNRAFKEATGQTPTDWRRAATADWSIVSAAMGPGYGAAVDAGPWVSA